VVFWYTDQRVLIPNGADDIPDSTLGLRRLSLRRRPNLNWLSLSFLALSYSQDHLKPNRGYLSVVVLDKLYNLVTSGSHSLELNSGVRDSV
jgi:hypothetical protein